MVRITFSHRSEEDNTVWMAKAFLIINKYSVKAVQRTSYYYNFMNNLNKVITTVATGTMFVHCINNKSKLFSISYCSEGGVFQSYTDDISVP